MRHGQDDVDKIMTLMVNISVWELVLEAALSFQSYYYYCVLVLAANCSYIYLLSSCIGTDPRKGRGEQREGKNILERKEKKRERNRMTEMSKRKEKRHKREGKGDREKITI